MRAARKFSFNWRWHRWLPIPGDTQLHLYDGGDVFFSRWLLQFWEVHSTQNLLEVSSLPVFFENDLNTSRQPGCGPVLRVLCALGCHSQQHYHIRNGGEIPNLRATNEIFNKMEKVVYPVKC